MHRRKGANTMDHADIGEIKDAFNRASDSVRLVALLSPT